MNVNTYVNYILFLMSFLLILVNQYKIKNDSRILQYICKQIVHILKRSNLFNNILYLTRLSHYSFQISQHFLDIIVF